MFLFFFFKAPLYPTVSDEATEPALQWSDEMEFDEELPPPANNTIITQMVAKKSDEDSGKVSQYQTFFRYIIRIEIIRLVWVLANGPGKPGFNPRSSHTKDSKNGTWCLLA